jgi:uncharacterized protein YfaS (alpha-2-macroglobulin family)
VKRAVAPLLTAVLLLALQLRGDAARPYQWIPRGFATFTPGQPIELRLRTNWPGDVTLKLYKLARSQSIALATTGASVETDALFSDHLMRSVVDPAANAKPSSQAQAQLGYLGLDKGVEHIVDVGPLPVGRYVALWGIDEARGVDLIDVTSIGMYVVDDGGHGPAAFALDMRTMRRRSDVSFAFYEPGKTIGLKPDAAGIVAIDDPNLPRGALVATASDGSMALATVGRPPGAQPFDPEAEVVEMQTDRSLYRPGQTAHFRGIFRRGDIGTYRVPTGTRTIELRDEHKPLAALSLALDEFGTVSGEFQLSDDASLGQYRISPEGPSSGVNFSVEAYRRPEYSIDVDPPPPNVIGGDRARFAAGVRYFFGRPAAGMNVHYQAYFSPNSFFGSTRSGVEVERESPPTPAPSATPTPAAGASPSPSPTPPREFTGDVRADAEGRVEVTVPTIRTEDEQTLSLYLDARDASGHTVRATSRMLVTPASFYLRVQPASYFVTSQEGIGLKVIANDYTGKPRASVDAGLEFASWTYDRVQKHWTRTPLDGSGLSVHTGSDGTILTTWRAPSSGLFDVTATARDEAGRRTWARRSFWVTAPGPHFDYHFESANLAPQQNSYKPGEAATLLATIPRGDVDALITVSDGGARALSIAHLPSLVSSIVVRPPADAASYSVTLTVPTTNGSTSATTVVRVDPPPRRLNVNVTPDRARYEPGAAARFTITVRDAQGKPARAQVALGIVDDSLLALQRNNVFDLFARFYGPRYGGTYSYATWANLNGPAGLIMAGRALVTIGRVQSRDIATIYQPGTVADVYSISASFDEVRKDFRETAFWSPNVVTGTDGRAMVSFNWPDSLTSYTADAAAITVSTDAGSGTSSSLVTKDFLVRLEVPRFLRIGDRASIVGIAQGRAGARGADLRFQAPSLGVADARSSVAFDKYATASAAWDVTASVLGSAPLRIAGASEQLRDAMELPLPVERATTAEHVRNAGQLPDASRLTLTLPSGYESGDVHLDLSPSVVGQLLQSFKLLQVYPYYCTEQTMSSVLPAAFLTRLAHRFALPVENVRAETIADQAITRLHELQHGDGSWGWWEHDGAHPFMTAYALYGLAELHDAGYDVSTWDLQRGSESLIAQLKSGNDDVLTLWGGHQAGAQWNTRAFMLFALARVQGRTTDRALFHDTDVQAQGLNAYALAVLGLAHHFAGDDASARPLLDRLNARAIDDGDFIHWQGATWHYAWEDDPVETTAYALRLNVALAPKSARVSKIVAWLRSQEHGSWWYTTKDTAAAIAAISESIESGSDEFTPHETVRVALDGKVLGSARFDSAFPGADASLRIPAAQLANGGTLTLEREGRGTLYWSSDWTRYLPAGRRTANDADASRLTHLHADLQTGISIQRRYTVPHRGRWRVGDEVGVELRVHMKSEQQYVAIEDAFPAGLEYLPVQYETGMNWSGIQFFDDRAAFFVPSAKAGETVVLRYRLRAMTAGAFTAPPPIAYAMYGPPSTAIGSPESVAVAAK